MNLTVNHNHFLSFSPFVLTKYNTKMHHCTVRIGYTGGVPFWFSQIYHYNRCITTSDTRCRPQTSAFFALRAPTQEPCIGRANVGECVLQRPLVRSAGGTCTCWLFVKRFTCFSCSNRVVTVVVNQYGAWSKANESLPCLAIVISDIFCMEFDGFDF